MISCTYHVNVRLRILFEFIAPKLGSKIPPFVMSKPSSCCFSQSIIQKKTNIRRQRREIFLQGHRQKHAQATEQSVQQQQQQQPLKQVENYTANATNAQVNQVVQSSPIKSMMNKSEGVTVAFGRTTKIQHQRSPSASKSLVRRHSLENDNVSTVYLSAQN